MRQKKRKDSENFKIQYPSDLTEEQWAQLEPYIPPAKIGGRPRSTDMYTLVNAILYLNRTSCQWRQLPHDYPNWSTVYRYFRQFCLDGTWESINTILRAKVRVAEGRKPTPSAAIIDSQSVKTTQAGGIRGYDAGKKVNGRKRHIIVDTIGLLLSVVVHPADIQDRDGAKLVISKIKGKFARLKLIWADGGYAGKLIDWVKENINCILEIVKRSDDVKGFKVLPRRWVVERTLAWLGFSRRLSKDYEETIESSESMVLVSSINILVHRLEPG